MRKILSRCKTQLNKALGIFKILKNIKEIKCTLDNMKLRLNEIELREAASRVLLENMRHEFISKSEALCRIDTSFSKLG